MVSLPMIRLHLLAEGGLHAPCACNFGSCTALAFETSCNHFANNASFAADNI